MPPSVKKPITVPRQEIQDVLTEAIRYPELANTVRELKSSVGQSTEGDIRLYKKAQSKLAILLAGIAYRQWNPYSGDELTVDSPLWNRLEESNSPAVYFPVYHPYFTANPHWSLRYTADDNRVRDAFEELFAHHESNLQYFEELLQVLPDNPGDPVKQLVDKIATHFKRTAADMDVLYRFPDLRYARDLSDRSHILTGQLTRLGRFIVDKLNAGRWKIPLRVKKDVEKATDRLTAQTSRKREGQTRKARKKKLFAVGDRIPGLKKWRIKGWPKSLRIWRHQIEDVATIRADMQRAMDHDRLYEGTVIAPTGSGKTHEMMATIAMAIDEWGLKFNGEKGRNQIFITTHLKTGFGQLTDKINELIGPFFKSRFKRDLRFSLVGNGEKDFSGDVVLISIPTLTSNPDLLPKQLRQMKKEGRTIPLVLMDEVHHVHAPTWQLFKARVRKVYPKTYILGFTATPNGDEPNPIVHRKPIDLINAGVLPNPDIIEVQTDTRLDTLIKTVRGDFLSASLSLLVNNQARHFQIMEKGVCV